MIRFRPDRRVIVTGAAAALAPLPALAQPFPSRPLRVLIPFAPAGGTDIAARLMGEQLATILGQPVVPDNRPGANGILAGEALRQAEPDGHTLLIGTAAAFSAAPALGQRLPYDVERDFLPVAMLGQFPLVLVAAPALGVRSLAEFIARAKAEPGRLNFASAGVGGTNHLVMEMIMQAAGLRLTHVPYRGAAPATQDLIAGQVQVFVDSLAAARPNIEAGRVVALAVTTDGRQPQLPDLPTLKEQGVDVSYAGWASVVVRADTPAATVAALNRAIIAALANEALLKRFGDLGIVTRQWSPEETAAFQRRDREMLTDLVRTAGIRVE